MSKSLELLHSEINYQDQFTKEIGQNKICMDMVKSFINLIIFILDILNKDKEILEDYI